MLAFCRELCYTIIRPQRGKGSPEGEQLVSMAVRVHPFPSRTRQLSSLALTILGWKRPGKISRRQHTKRPANRPGVFYFVFFMGCKQAEGVSLPLVYRSVRNPVGSGGACPDRLQCAGDKQQTRRQKEEKEERK